VSRGGRGAGLAGGYGEVGMARRDAHKQGHCCGRGIERCCTVRGG
jgi:hypothetical protein